MGNGTMIFIVFQLVVCLFWLIGGIYFGLQKGRDERIKIAVIVAVGILFSGFITKFLFFIISIILMALFSIICFALVIVGILLAVAIPIPIIGLPVYIWKKILK